jgi:hypothetical protein
VAEIVFFTLFDPFDLQFFGAKPAAPGDVHMASGLWSSASRHPR